MTEHADQTVNVVNYFIRGSAVTSEWRSANKIVMTDLTVGGKFQESMMQTAGKKRFD